MRVTTRDDSRSSDGHGAATRTRAGHRTRSPRGPRTGKVATRAFDAGTRRRRPPASSRKAPTPSLSSCKCANGGRCLIVSPGWAGLAAVGRALPGALAWRGPGGFGLTLLSSRTLAVEGIDAGADRPGDGSGRRRRVLCVTGGFGPAHPCSRCLRGLPPTPPCRAGSRGREDLPVGRMMRREVTPFRDPARPGKPCCVGAGPGQCSRRLPEFSGPEDQGRPAPGTRAPSSPAGLQVVVGMQALRRSVVQRRIALEGVHRWRALQRTRVTVPA
jgi:hypothetical protein